MVHLALSRFQFGSTTTYHFFFVPLTMGLSLLVAFMEWRYVESRNPLYQRMAKFFGHLFMINFALGVVTGLVQEFQFGMNWSEYSRFVGDIFGVPLAIEALLAFFLESTFLGLWFFTWDKVSPKLHNLFIWLVAIGSNLSGLWILIANSFMQYPVGYKLEGGRAVLTDFAALVLSPHVWLQFPHTALAALTTAAFFVAAVSAWHLLRKNEVELFLRAMRIALITAAASGFLVMLIGHFQADFIVEHQPMKFAAMEALWDDVREPAPWTVVAAINEAEMKNDWELKIPGVLSLLAHSKDGVFKGIKTIQRAYEERYGPGNYVPPVKVTFWSFRVMVASGVLMFLLALVGLWLLVKEQLVERRGFLTLILWAVLLPYIANTTGWWVTEFGRQPWMVQGLLTVYQGVTPPDVVGPPQIVLSALGFTLLYAVLGVLDVWLLAKYAKAGPEKDEAQALAY